MPTIKEKKDRALNQSLKKTIKERYPDDWKEIVKCIEAAINTGLEEIDKCLKVIAIITPEDRDQLKKGPRSFITVGGG